MTNGMKDRHKIRVWDVGDRRYITVTPIAGSRLVNSIHVGLDGQLYEDVQFEGPCPLHEELYIREQCTGLKDKNGTLIYEGDIVSFSTESEGGDTFHYKNKPVVYHNDLSLFGFPVTVHGSYKLPIQNYANALYQAERDIEIIGNIHENPELLEE